MAFKRIGSVLLHYRMQGPMGAPTIALVNSLGTDARIWDSVIEGLVPRYRVISYDKRGHGLSDAPAGEYRLEDHVDDLAGLLDHLGVQSLVMAGVSVGGLISQAYALRHPERLRGLVLCDTAAKIGDVAAWEQRIAAVRSGGMDSLVDAVMERWFAAVYRREKPDQLAGWRNMFMRIPAHGYANTCATLRDADLREKVHAIRTPTLVVAGDQDLATPVELVRDTAERIPDARFVEIANAGHIPSIEQPETLIELMQSFLSEIGHD